MRFRVSLSRTPVPASTLLGSVFSSRHSELPTVMVSVCPSSACTVKELLGGLCELSV